MDLLYPDLDSVVMAGLDPAIQLSIIAA